VKKRNFAVLDVLYGLETHSFKLKSFFRTIFKGSQTIVFYSLIRGDERVLVKLGRAVKDSLYRVF
jgi:hypothetical protein